MSLFSFKKASPSRVTRLDIKFKFTEDKWVKILSPLIKENFLKMEEQNLCVKWLGFARLHLSPIGHS